MPEGPSLIIAKEALLPFKKKKVIGVSGTTKVDVSAVAGLTITDIRSWGKHLLICFPGYTIRIHLLMFGTYLINTEKALKPRLSLQLKNDVINFYTCSVLLIEGDINNFYDWQADVMSPTWSATKARRKLKTDAQMNVSDALLDQDIFAGVGNIIKNEVLFRIKVHPDSIVGQLPAAKLNSMIREAVVYSFEFLEWKKAFELKKHWLAYTKKVCPRDGTKFIKAYTGKGKRRSFYCETCQRLYN